jgi:hypothetical protein
MIRTQPNTDAQTAARHLKNLLTRTIFQETQASLEFFFQELRTAFSGVAKLKQHRLAVDFERQNPGFLFRFVVINFPGTTFQLTFDFISAAIGS